MIYRYTKQRNPIGCCALAKNCDWFRQITPLSNMTQVLLLRGMTTFSKAKIELRNLQFLKKMLEKSSQFLSSDQPSEPKSLDVALITAGVENTLGKLAIAINLEVI